ncbi:Hypothetical predicted protein [Octopus vulgaris]|uniref:Uncharacterized protein n=1 Tax=Octopus vulgaris TaxID=6645 RepID=A0AA36F7N0_OCTVU|nr:Hypothetical predicted protein [Octopus vulgaris]
MNIMFTVKDTIRRIVSLAVRPFPVPNPNFLSHPSAWFANGSNKHSPRKPVENHFVTSGYFDGLNVHNPQLKSYR